MSQTSSSQALLTVAELSQNRPNTFELNPDTATRAALAAEFGLLDLQKLRFKGQINSSGRHDWLLTGQLGATVTQACVATLAPVKTRLDQPVKRLFTADFDETDAPESEMPQDDNIEPLTATIDLQAILAEALALALPAYPRAEGVEMTSVQVTEPGAEPLKDGDLKPFAGLKALRDRLDG